MMLISLKIDVKLTLGVDSNAHISLLFSDLQIIREHCKCYKKDKESFIPTENIFFDTDPKRKHIKRHFSTCLLQAQKAEMVSRENKTESLFLLTIALSYKISLNPQPPLTVDFPLSLSLSFSLLLSLAQTLAFPFSFLKGKQALL